MITALIYVHDLNGGLYSERYETLSRRPQAGEFIKLDATLCPYRVDAVSERAAGDFAVYVTRETHGICLRGERGTVAGSLEVFIPGVVA